MNCIKCGANVTVGATKCYNCSHPFNKIETEVVTIPKHQITVLTCENTILTAKVAELEKKLKTCEEQLSDTINLMQDQTFEIVKINSELKVADRVAKLACSAIEGSQFFNTFGIPLNLPREQRNPVNNIRAVIDHFKQQAQKEE